MTTLKKFSQKIYKSISKKPSGKMEYQINSNSSDYISGSYTFSKEKNKPKKTCCGSYRFRQRCSNCLN